MLIRSFTFLALMIFFLVAIFFGSRRPILLRAPAENNSKESEIPLSAVADQNEKRIEGEIETVQSPTGTLIIEKADPELGNSLVIEPIPREPSSVQKSQSR